ncbi:hypothetical protein [Shewanella algae]|uniref:hypothetical protein n=1 Tax=Shewanella algae TaxID=38313 RepID=UPI0031F5AC76
MQSHKTVPQNKSQGDGILPPFKLVSLAIQILCQRHPFTADAAQFATMTKARQEFADKGTENISSHCPPVDKLKGQMKVWVMKRRR